MIGISPQGADLKIKEGVEEKTQKNDTKIKVCA
jgi:hypothetical protein